jgi:hypothetical protein
MADTPTQKILEVDLPGVHEVNWAHEIEVAAMRATLIFGLIQLISVMIVEWSDELTPLTGEPGSVGGQAIISCLILCLIVTPIAFLRGINYRNTLKSEALPHKRNWAVVPVTIGVALLVLLLVVGGFEIFNRTFEDVMLDKASSATILVLLIGVLAYVISRTIMATKTAGLLVNLMAIYLLATLFFAAYFNDNPLWWQRSFSYLGMTESNSHYIFNIGLVFTGILAIAWQYFFMESFDILESHGNLSHREHTIIRWVLVIAGIALATVGIVRYGIGLFFNIVHDVAATGMGVIVGLLMVGLYWLVRGYTRVFYILSAVMAIMIATAAVLKVMGKFNLVGLELAGFALAALWLVLFYRNTELLVAETVEEARDEA